MYTAENLISEVTEAIPAGGTSDLSASSRAPGFESFESGILPDSMRTGSQPTNEFCLPGNGTSCREAGEAGGFCALLRKLLYFGQMCSDLLVCDTQGEIFRSENQNFENPPNSPCSLRVRFSEPFQDGKMQGSTCVGLQQGVSGLNA